MGLYDKSCDTDGDSLGRDEATERADPSESDATDKPGFLDK